MKSRGISDFVLEIWVDNSAAASLSLNGYFNCP